MPWSHDEAVRSLRLRYNAALAAHQSCARALTEATLAGDSPTAAAVESESIARAALHRAREELYAAMAALVASQPASDVPGSKPPPPELNSESQVPKRPGS